MNLLWLSLLPLGAFGKDLVSEFHNDTQSLLWGPYRPNLYFGLRPRLPQSLMTGLMWFGTHEFSSIGRKFSSKLPEITWVITSSKETRHACDQGDGLDSYTWTEYDPRDGGVQVLKDSKNNVKITTEFLKVPGGKNGGSWAARVKGQPMNPSKHSFHLGEHTD